MGIRFTDVLVSKYKSYNPLTLFSTRSNVEIGQGGLISNSIWGGEGLKTLFLTTFRFQESKIHNADEALRLATNFQLKPVATKRFPGSKDCAPYVFFSN